MFYAPSDRNYDRLLPLLRQFLIFQIALITLWISEHIFLLPGLINSAAMWSVPGECGLCVNMWFYVPICVAAFVFLCFYMPVYVAVFVFVCVFMCLFIQLQLCSCVFYVPIYIAVVVFLCAYLYSCSCVRVCFMCLFIQLQLCFYVPIYTAAVVFLCAYLYSCSCVFMCLFIQLQLCFYVPIYTAAVVFVCVFMCLFAANGQPWHSLFLILRRRLIYFTLSRT